MGRTFWRRFLWGVVLAAGIVSVVPGQVELDREGDLDTDLETGLPGDETREALDLVALTSGDRFEIDRGGEFELRFTVPGDDPEQVRLGIPPLPEGVSQPDGPVAVTRGRREMEVRIPFRGDVAGRFVVESILVDTPSATLETPPVLVEVRDPQRDRVPFRAAWRLLSDQVWQGQSVPVVLEITDIDSFAFPESVSFRSPQTGLFEEVSGIGSVASREIAGRTIYRIPVASFLFTPAAAGTVALPAATIRADGIDVQAPALEVEVTELPGIAGEADAVGDFSLESRVEPRRIAPGETGLLEITITGAGNLPVLEFPEVSLDGLVEVERIQEGSFEPDVANLSGYVGSRTLRIRFEVEGEVESGMVRIAPFIAYDPRSDLPATVPSRTFPVELVREDAAASEATPPPQIELIEISRLTSPFWIPLGEVPWTGFLLLLGPIVFAAVRLISVRGAAALIMLPLLVGATIFPRIDVQRLQRAAEIAEEGRPAVAGVLYDLELQREGWHPGLHYNRGVLALRADNAVTAIYHLRLAARLAPELRRFRSTLATAEDYFGADASLDVPVHPRPDLFIFVLSLVWTVAWVLLSVRGRLRRTIGLVTLAMVGVVLLAGWGWSYRLATIDEAVVARPVTVRRIPDMTAQPWLQIDPSTVVRVELSYEEFLLIRTTAGVNGWIPESAVWVLGEH
jgi:hypothetical protein